MIERKFGVVGDPIAHSLSPFIHRLAYQFYGFNYEYQPYLVKSGSLASFLKQHPDLNGLSV
ncbi:MAG: shikimate dehydrogenase, partial [Microbacteriaceae bacterium]|nr:shikimate dehydrogenase [Microbacteriaceae bacterium]